jgi:hypothetical protein
MKSPLSYFSTLKDPRVERTREHNLEDILFIALLPLFAEPSKPPTAPVK